MNLHISRVSALVLFCASFALCLNAYDRLVVFGDSLSDTGNLSLASGPSLYPALNYDPLRLTSGPTTSPASGYTGVAVERLNALLGLPTLAPSLMGGSNYAWAYATSGVTGVTPTMNVVPGVKSQVATYLAAHGGASSESLYVVFAGANDIFQASTPADILASGQAAAANLKAEIELLLAAGARNILWFNVPDLALTPAAVAAGPGLTTLWSQASAGFRAGWTQAIAEIDSLYPTTNILGVDTYAFMQAVVSAPNAFGLTNATASAQLLSNVNPDEYLFWDHVHPTANAHRLLAEHAYAQLTAVPEVSSSAAAGLALLVLAAHRLVRARRRGAGAE